MSPKSDNLTNLRQRARASFYANNLPEANALYTRILSSDKKDLEALHALGTLQQRSGHLAKAEKLFRRFLKINRNNHEVLYQLATVLQRTGRNSEAQAALAKSVQIQPRFFEAWVLRGNLYAWSGELGKATAAYKKAIAINPKQPVPRCNLGNVLADSGNASAAYKEWQQALFLEPRYAAAHSNMLLAMNYSERFRHDEIFTAHKNWARQHLRDVKPFSHHRNTPDPARKLRIGYLSPDFREHSVAYFIRPILRSQDRSRYEITTYAAVASPDTVTDEIKTLSDRFRNIAALPDTQVAKQIAKDRIDILIDLSGHTSGHRLRVFGHKPAPVQITYLGYPNTTGLTQIDYRLTDSNADPEDSIDKFYTEQLIRMPHGFLCYEPPKKAPAPSAPPCINNNHTTFGSFNYTAKISSDTVRVWSEILHRVPGSRLLLKYRSFSDPTTCEEFLDQFCTHNIDPQRISFRGLTPDKNAHLAVYNKIDIALDTFPYNGTTTTCDTLWMGVPVVGLAGNSHAARVGVSLLKQAGLEELIAESKADYIELATLLASDPERLMRYRKTLRDRISSSTLCDGVAFTEDIEHIFRLLWTEWCHARSSCSPTTPSN